MSRIKTREKVQGVKTIDKAAIASERMRQTAIRAKEKTSALVDNNSYSSEEYAQDKYQNSVEDIGREGTHGVVSGSKQIVHRGKEFAQKQKGKKQASEHTEDGSLSVAENTPNTQTAQGRSSMDTQTPKERYQKPDKKYAVDSVKNQRTERNNRQTSADARSPSTQRVKGPERSVKQSKRSTGKSTIKTVQNSKRPSNRSIKTAQRTEKVAVKTAEATAKTAKKTAQASRQAVQRLQAAAKAAMEIAKATAKAVASAIKAIIQGAKTLAAAIASGGSVAVIAIVVIMLIALLVGSCFGIFFSSEEKTDGSARMCNVVREINQEFDDKIEQIKNSVSYDVLELSGGHATWQDILAVYAVITTNSKEDGMEVATVDDVKKNKLREVFWDMTTIDYTVESITTGSGEDKTTTVYLYITVTSKTADEIASEYEFDSEQKEQLHELTKSEYRSLWMSVIYGIKTGSGGGSSDIVAVALSQIGNIGGEPYWSWYGFPSRVEWCACFVSWCANECGYIESGAVPMYAYCPFGVDWFKSHGQWMDGSETPEPGMIIFFDWDNRGSSGPQDGVADHTGIVERVENGYIYTVEGNSSDGCRERQYLIGSHETLGYGIIGKKGSRAMQWHSTPLTY